MSAAEDRDPSGFLREFHRKIAARNRANADACRKAAEYYRNAGLRTHCLEQAAYFDMVAATHERHITDAGARK